MDLYITPLEEKVFTCNFCEEQHPTKQSLTKHLQTHMIDKPFACNMCNKKFAKKFILTLHIRSHTGEKPYACDTCEKRFPQKSDLTRHQRVHTGVKPYICDICFKTFNQKPSLTQHRRTHTGEKPFSCETCHKQFNKKASVIEHCCEVPSVITDQTTDGTESVKISTIKNKPFKCSLCLKQLSTKFSLIEHERVHTTGKLYVCTVCDKKFAYRSSFLKHDLSHNADEKTFTCEVCYRNFANKSAVTLHTCAKPDSLIEVYILPDSTTPYEENVPVEPVIESEEIITIEEPETALEHIEISAEEKPYSCHICNKGFSKKYILALHIRSHTGEKPYVCDVCNKRFPQRSDLTRHIRVHTGEKPYACDLCPKRFAQKPGLTQHRRTHTGEKPFSCKKCHKRFNKKASVIEHCCIQLKSESENLFIGSKQSASVKIKPFTCGVNGCEKKFSNKFGLALHRQLHLRDTRYVCDICNKEFSYQSTLNKHLRCHTGEMSFACEICDEKFPNKSLLNFHMHSHKENGQPFKCQTCNKTFQFKCNLTAHNCEKVGDWLTCPICAREFSSKRNLTRHVRHVHASDELATCIKCYAVVETSGATVCNTCARTISLKLSQVEPASDTPNLQILARVSVEAYAENSSEINHSDATNLQSSTRAATNDSLVEDISFELTDVNLEPEECTDKSVSELHISEPYSNTPNLQILTGTCVDKSSELKNFKTRIDTPNLQILAGASALRQRGKCNDNPFL